MVHKIPHTAETKKKISDSIKQRSIDNPCQVSKEYKVLTIQCYMIQYMNHVNGTEERYIDDRGDFKDFDN
jgi:hypothetical protein